MAKPTAVTEAGTAKVLLLADSSATTPGANTPAAVAAGTSAEPTYPVGWLGVATHRQGDVRVGPGGFTLGSAPVVAAGGFDSSAAGTARGFRTDEDGVQLVRTTGAIERPLSQNGAGGITVSAASEVGIVTADTTRFGYLSRLHMICIGTVNGGAGTGSWGLKNANGGTVIVRIPWVLAPALKDQIILEFPNPLKTGTAGGSFTLTPSSTFLGTWHVMANGHYSIQ